MQPAPQPIIFHTLVNASDQVHTFVNEEMPGFQSARLELERMVEELSFERVMELISILAARVRVALRENPGTIEASLSA